MRGAEYALHRRRCDRGGIRRWVRDQSLFRSNSTNHRIDFWDQTYDMTDAKILCSQADGGLKILITGPDGTRVTSQT